MISKRSLKVNTFYNIHHLCLKMTFSCVFLCVISITYYYKVQSFSAFNFKNLLIEGNCSIKFNTFYDIYHHLQSDLLSCFCVLWPPNSLIPSKTVSGCIWTATLTSALVFQIHHLCTTWNTSSHHITPVRTFSHACSPVRPSSVSGLMTLAHLCFPVCLWGRPLTCFCRWAQTKFNKKSNCQSSKQTTKLKIHKIFF